MNRYRFALRFALAGSLFLALAPLASADSSARFAQGQASASTMLSPERLANIDRYISADIDKAIVPGGILMIFKDGQRVYEKIWGERDPQTKQPMTADTIFRI
jgi:CubicO group peptidase (beta-lactamase class C family)